MAALDLVPPAEKEPLIRYFVRPLGFEPETCGADLSHMQRSVAVRTSWSEWVVSINVPSRSLAFGLMAAKLATG